MEQLSTALEEIMKRLKSNTGMEEPKKMTDEEYIKFKCDAYNQNKGNLNDSDGYNCEKCNNKGFIAEPRFQNDSWYEVHCECQCQRVRKTLIRLARSGLKDIINKYSFNAYVAEEQWQATLKERALSYAKDPKGWFFIGGQTGCVDADTEYFDGEKWVRIADYRGGKVLQYHPDSKKATLTQPERYIAVSAEKLYHIKTKRGGINQVLSDNHNFAYITSKGHMQKKPFRDVMKLHKENVQGFYGRIETAFSYGGCGIDLTDSEIRLMCAVMADGSFKSSSNRCIVNVKKQRKKDRMIKLLNDVGCDYKEYKKANGYSAFKFYAPRREKAFTEFWYDCNQHQLGVIADEVFYWDGSVDDKGRKSFFSTYKTSADFVQFALSSNGTRATISEDTHRRKVCYVVIASQGNSTVSMSSSGGRSKAEIVEYEPIDGKQYCFTVETGYLVLRRKGRIFITGNSGKTHLCTAICGAMLKSDKSVKYMLWRDDITKIKSNVTDAKAYESLITEYKNEEVLYIDDLFKNGKGNDGKVQPPTGADIQVAFEILNYRYNNPKLITIISSERDLYALADIDEAVAGRISEMSFKNGYGFNIKSDMKKNYRLKGLVDL